MRKKTTVGLAVVLSWMCAGMVEAQEDTIITDRPDLTESTAVVGKNRFQIETSFLYERNDEGPDEEGYFTPTLLRYGIMEEVEARLETDLFSHLSQETALGERNTTGYSPLTFGLKAHLLKASGSFLGPETSVLLNVGTPTGSSDFASDDVTGDIKLLFDWEPAEDWSVGANVGMAYDVDDNDDGFLSGIATVALGHAWTDNFGTFWELAYQGPASSEDDHDLIFDTGVTYLLNPNAQVDFAVGTGLAGDTTPDVFVTAGISLRF